MMPATTPTTWLFLRGLTRESAHWGRFPSAFQRAMPLARVVMLDLPGNGVQHGVASPTSIAAMVAWCQAKVARLGLTGPFHLLAMSLGAMVATEWAYRAPQAVAGCVLINTSMRPFSPFYRRLRPRHYAPLLGRALLGASAEEWEHTVLRLTSNAAPGQHHGAVADWVAARLQRPVSTRNALRQLLAAVRYRAQVSSPPTRILLLASEKDGLVDAACSRAVAQAWGCEVAWHPWAGHDLPLDDAAWVVRAVRRWQRCEQIGL